MKLIRFYFPNAIYRIVYMLQQLEYEPLKLVYWLSRMPDLKQTINRGKLVLTKKALSLLIVGYLVYLGSFFGGFYLTISGNYLVGLFLIFCSSDMAILSLLLLALMGKKILLLRRAPLMKRAERIFINHPGHKIAIIGSYGKTSTKEILNTVLSQKFKVAMTPGNKNVPISHARWASSEIAGDEDFLIIEYGEGEPGDIDRLASLSRPDMVIMSGIAPNHLDHYKTYENLISDFLEIQKYVQSENLFVNASAKSFIDKLANKAPLYSEKHVDGWTISDIKISISGTRFIMKKGSDTLKLSSEIIGRHNVAALSLSAAIGLKYGMTKQEVETAVSNTLPFEHRMQARQLGGAWLIDDTYNGNLEGFRAGLSLLSELDAKRKIYVTPGLVDQGEETETVHTEIGKLIAACSPDKVILMQNSNTDYVVQSLKMSGYIGELSIETNPLEFYTNLDKYVAGGDLVLMQNDLPDSYS